MAEKIVEELRRSDYISEAFNPDDFRVLSKQEVEELKVSSKDKYYLYVSLLEEYQRKYAQDEVDFKSDEDQTFSDILVPETPAQQEAADAAEAQVTQTREDAISSLSDTDFKTLISYSDVQIITADYSSSRGDYNNYRVKISDAEANTVKGFAAEQMWRAQYGASTGRKMGGAFKNKVDKEDFTGISYSFDNIGSQTVSVSTERVLIEKVKEDKFKTKYNR